MGLRFCCLRQRSLVWALVLDRRLNERSRAYFYLTDDGPLSKGIAGDENNLSAFWSNPLKWTGGLTQETCRDNGHHSQFGVGSAMYAAEVAWHQGVDVYSEHEKILYRGNGTHGITQKLTAEQIRPGAPRAVWNLALDILTHADLPAKNNK